MGGAAMVRKDLVRLASWLYEQSTAAWARTLGHLVTSVATPGHLRLLALIVGGDGLLSATEAWLLLRGFRWASWIVVCATGVFIPWGLYEVIVAPHLARVVLLVLNVAVVSYLIARRGGPPALAPPRRHRHHPPRSLAETGQLAPKAVVADL